MTRLARWAATALALFSLTPALPRATLADTATVLTATDPADENTLDQPAKVAPVSETLRGVGPSSRPTFPPHSLTILRLKESR